MSPLHTEPPRLAVDYHDGRNEQAQSVVIWVSQGMLELAGHGVLRQIPIHQVHWPDSARQEDVRIILLPGGGSLRGHDPAAWDAWQQQQDLAPARSLLASRQSWRWSLVAVMLLLALCAASYVFALPPSRG
ncbi:DUF7092 domain-containing protein [Aquabacterium sp.]|uniref:DUF7092 domain-containing protein n=1 Tax=Aquabacterium sp. TaxID=1872578 RepID=UPI003D6D89CF